MEAIERTAEEEKENENEIEAMLVTSAHACPRSHDRNSWMHACMIADGRVHVLLHPTPSHLITILRRLSIINDPCQLPQPQPQPQSQPHDPSQPQAKHDPHTYHRPFYLHGREMVVSFDPFAGPLAGVAIGLRHTHTHTHTDTQHEHFPPHLHVRRLYVRREEES